MANKYEVLRLLAMGKTPKQVSQELDCMPEYVRATRQRARPGGAAKAAQWQRDRLKRSNQFSGTVTEPTSQQVQR